MLRNDAVNRWRRRPRLAKMTMAWILFFPLLAWSAPPFVEHFDGEQATWRLRETPRKVTVAPAQRNPQAGRTGGGEVWRFDCQIQQSTVRLEHRVPSARVFDEVTASVWVRADNPGWTIDVVIVCPGLIDPKTDQPAEIVLAGDVYRDAGHWQPLQVRTSDRLLAQKLVHLRARFGATVELGEMYIDRVALGCPLPSGPGQIAIDELELSPVVTPTSTIPNRLSNPSVETSTAPPVSFRLGRLQVGGRPFFPRLVRHRGEAPQSLAAAGFNTVWIEDVDDSEFMTQLRAQQLWAAATPPQPPGEPRVALSTSTPGLMPFSPATDAVLCWMLGARVPGEDRPQLVNWIEQIEMADRRRMRPIAVDVLGDERLFSRDVGLLATSRHPLQTTFSLVEYRDWLTERRLSARPGTFFWTWIQTEPSPSLQALYRQGHASSQLEPEQIRLQTYAALAAGCQGLGFWTTSSIDGDDPSAQERRLILQQLNLELALMEPWLATTKSVSRAPCAFSTPPAVTTSKTGRNSPFTSVLPNRLERDAQARTRDAATKRQQSLAEDLSAAVFSTEYDTLLMPMWLEKQAQFVPPPSAAHNLTLTVPGGGQTASAWEISTTDISSLPSEPVAGGRRITLPALDQTAIIWLTSNTKNVEGVRQRIQGLKGASARIAVELARLKFARVAHVDQTLQMIAPLQADGPQLLGRARLALDRAESALRNGEHHQARLAANESMQTLRILQRGYWDDAVKPMTAPVSSPHTMSFQTLPEHWQMVAQLGRSRSRDDRNLLPAGEFEDVDTLIAERWKNEHRAPEGLRTTAELFPSGRSGRFALRLACEAGPGAPPPEPLVTPAISVTTPAIAVQSGRLLHISGWVKLRQPVTAHPDGLLIYDSLLGKTGALRFHAKCEWTKFELIREVPESQDWTLTIALAGVGDVLLDDLQVIPQERWSDAAQTESDAPIQRTSGTTLFDRFPKLSRFTPARRD